MIGWIKTSRRNFANWELLVIHLFSRYDGGIGCQWKVDPWVGHLNMAVLIRGPVSGDRLFSLRRLINVLILSIIKIIYFWTTAWPSLSRFSSSYRLWPSLCISDGTNFLDNNFVDTSCFRHHFLDIFLDTNFLDTIL